MAAIPTYIHFGDELITGGELNVKPSTGIAFSATGSLAGLATMITEYQRVVPSGPDGLTGGAYLSYYDGTYVKSWQASAGTIDTISIATAQWKVNHFQTPARTITITAGTGAGQSRTVASNTTTQITVTADWVTPPDATSVFHLGPGERVMFHYARTPLSPIAGAAGDNWFEFESITPTGMLMQRLGQLYANQAPGFRFLKLAQPNGMPGWKAGGAARTQLMLRLNDLRGIEEGLGNTLDVRAVIVDCATRDIFGANLAFQADLDGVIAMIRAEISATALIVLVVPHQLVARTSFPPMAPAVRTAIRETVVARRAAGDPNIALFDMNWGTFTWRAGESNAAEPADPRYYDLPTVIQTGIGLFNVIAAHYAPAPPVPIGKALAGVAILSDSQFVGQGHNPLMALYADQPSMLGANTPDTTKENVWVWDDGMQQLVLYDVMSNGNNYGAIGGMGCDVTLPRKLLRRYPQGVVIFKYAKNGLCLTPEGHAVGGGGYIENGGAILEDVKVKFTRCRVSCLQITNRSMDMIGLCHSLGENDASAGAAATTAFEARVGNWVDDVRDIFTTRVDGVLPIVWMQGPPPATEVTGGSVLGLATYRNRYRTRLVALETQKPRLKVVRNNGPDDWELSRDQIHYGGETLWRIGDQLAIELLALIDLEDAVDSGSVDGGTDDEGAADGLGDEPAGTEDGPGTAGTGGLIVEDGTGIDDAESLATVEQFREFWVRNGNPASVSGATDEACAAVLRRATREWVEGVCAGKWRGSIQFPNQRLSWPRRECHDDEGRVVPIGTIPWQLVDATCLVAGDLLAGGNILVAGVERGPVVRETKRGLGFEKTMEFAETGSAASGSVRRLRAAEALVYPFVRGGGTGVARS